jgi:hypothetical protein
MEYEPILAFFQGFEPFLEARTSVDSDSHQGEKSDPDQHQIKNRNPDPHQRDADPQHCYIRYCTHPAPVARLHPEAPGGAPLLLLVCVRCGGGGGGEGGGGDQGGGGRHCRGGRRACH